MEFNLTYNIVPEEGSLLVSCGWDRGIKYPDLGEILLYSNVFYIPTILEDDINWGFDGEYVQLNIIKLSDPSEFTLNDQTVDIFLGHFTLINVTNTYSKLFISLISSELDPADNGLEDWTDELPNPEFPLESQYVVVRAGTSTDKKKVFIEFCEINPFVGNW